jgi:hypothetical protein
MADSKSNAARFTAGKTLVLASMYGGPWCYYATGIDADEAGWHRKRVENATGGDCEVRLVPFVQAAAAPALYEATVEDDALAVAIEATLRSVAVPSGCPEVSRAFADIRGMLQATTAKRRSALAQARGEA